MSNLNEWIAGRTFHFSEFSDIKRLVKLKEEQKLKISLCFPTLNEERTIGQSIVLMKGELQDRHPLLDEIAVVDSGSNDKTLSIAAKFGAGTYAASDYLPEEGCHRGKGENLWKALYLLQGDIILFVDADIANIHPRFAYGLLGPILHNPEIKFVKAFYNRPFKNSAGVSPSGGGRVTEILIRPLFSQFFPELSGLIQPLSGEYAGRRSLFEQINFPVGYGVETGMLIDIAQKWGLPAMAQVNLDSRIHRNQSIASLGKMSFGVLQTFWSRLHQYRGIPAMPLQSYVLRQMELHNREFNLLEHEIQEFERRPIIQVPAYQEKRRNLDAGTK